MKYSMMFRGTEFILNGIMKKSISSSSVRKQIRHSYREIVERAKDIGSDNNLLFSYALAAYFIAMNRKDGLDAEENYQILEKGLRNSKLLKVFMGNADGYFSEKHMEFRRQWSKRTYQKKYENDWVVDVIEGNGDYEFGFNYKECGVCKLCRDEGCFELAHYMCRLDFMLVEIIGIHLKRTKILADGDDVCDFRFYK